MSVPASMTMVSFSTATWPVARSTRTRAAQATHVGILRSCPNVDAMPRPTSFGMARPQPAFLAARASTAACRCAPSTEFGADPELPPAPSSKLSRNATGSPPASWAASSIKLSTAQLVQPALTDLRYPDRNVRSARSLRIARTRCAPTLYQWSAPEMANGSYGLPLASLPRKYGAIVVVGQPATAW